MKIALTLVLSLALALPLNAARTTIPAGTPVMVRLDSLVSSATNHKGEVVPMSVASAIVINGKTVIKEGTPVQADIEDVSKKFFAGIGGYVKLAAQSTKAVDGTLVPLKFEKQDSGKANLFGIIVGVVCCCCFLLLRGEDVSIQPGTIYNALTLGPIEIEMS
jgi:hypothetical protein